MAGSSTFNSAAGDLEALVKRPEVINIQTAECSVLVHGVNSNGSEYSETLHLSCVRYAFRMFARLLRDKPSQMPASPTGPN
jgi:hypothetical protein